MRKPNLDALVRAPLSISRFLFKQNIISFMILFAAAAISFESAYLIEPRNSAGKYAPLGYSFDTSRVNVLEGNYVYRIPRNYLASWNPHLAPRDAVGLHVILPDLQPISPENSKCFAVACDKIMWITLATGSFSEEYMKSKGHVGDPNAKTAPVLFSLTEYVEAPFGGEIKVYRAYISDNRLFVLICTGGNDPRLAVCQHSESLHNDSYFEYHFNIKFLRNWREIEEKTVALMSSFEDVTSDKN